MTQPMQQYNLGSIIFFLNFARNAKDNSPYNLMLNFKSSKKQYRFILKLDLIVKHWSILLCWTIQKILTIKSKIITICIWILLFFLSLGSVAPYCWWLTNLEICFKSVLNSRYFAHLTDRFYFLQISVIVHYIFNTVYDSLSWSISFIYNSETHYYTNFQTWIFKTKVFDHIV